MSADIERASPPNNESIAPISNEEHAHREDALPSVFPQYTSFSRKQRKQLQLLLGLAAITSPLTATIYLPLLPLLRTHFDTSAQAINLTLTLYIVFQAISPVIFGPLSDAHGRRPYLLFTLALYVVGNLGLAINERSYAILLVLRAVQSLGASAAYAISFGVVADICVPSERGGMLGPISMALNLGTCIGPVVGGVVAYTSGGYAWVFWALFIVGGLLFASVGAFLPETARNVVGDGGDVSLYKCWQCSWLYLVQNRVRTGATNTSGASDTTVPRSTQLALSPVAQKRYGLSNLLACFRIMFFWDTFLVLWIHGSFYTVDYAFVAAAPDIFQDVYHWNELQIGLSYLPRGIGIIAGSYFTGKLMDHNYRVVAQEISWAVDHTSGEDLIRFPIERARTGYSYYILAISTSTMIGYGWSIHERAHPAVLMVLQFLQGFWGTYGYTTFSTLLVDSFPQSPSTAAAATSIARCAMAATGVAVLQPLLDAAGRGWYFTILGLWSGVLAALAVFLLRLKGLHWRQRRSGISVPRTTPETTLRELPKSGQKTTL